MQNVQKETTYTDQQLVEAIREGDKQAFKQLFFSYYYDIRGFAAQMVHSKEHAKDIVQEVFCTLWKRRKKWRVHTSVKAYLFQSVRNETLNQLDRDQYRQKVRTALSKEKSGYSSIMEENHTADEKLIEQIWQIVSAMPERRRSVFVLHRKHGLSYKEIAGILGVTRKTVENHMGLALGNIREQLNQQKVPV
jgi:RNA polymerase sigma-70 factor (ECF subfamily)